MKKILALLFLAALGYGLFTHWDEALELNRALRLRPHRNLSDKDLLHQQLATQERVLGLYRQKDALHEKGLKDLKGLYQSDDIEGAIVTEKQALAELDRERLIRKVFRSTELALLVGLPALIFIGLLTRVIRRRSRGKFYAPAPDHEPPRRGWLPFRTKAAPGPVSPVRIGATQAEILGRLGPPLQRTLFTETEAWSYRIPLPAPSPDGGLSFTQYRSLIVLFRNQKVFDLSWGEFDPGMGPIEVD